MLGLEGENELGCPPSHRHGAVRLALGRPSLVLIGEIGRQLHSEVEGHHTTAVVCEIDLLVQPVSGESRDAELDAFPCYVVAEPTVVVDDRQRYWAKMLCIY